MNCTVGKQLDRSQLVTAGSCAGSRAPLDTGSSAVAVHGTCCLACDLLEAARCLLLEQLGSQQAPVQDAGGRKTGHPVAAY